MQFARMRGWAKAVPIAFLVAAAGPSEVRAAGSLTQVAGEGGCIGQGKVAGCAEGKALVKPTALAVSPDGKILFAGSSGESGWRGGIAQLDIAANGSLTQRGCITDDAGNGGAETQGACVDGDGLQSVDDLAVAPDGKTVYTVSGLRSSIASFGFADTGGLRQLACLTVWPLGRCTIAPATHSARGIAISPDGRYAYVASSEDAPAYYNDEAPQTNDPQSNAIAVFARDPDSGLLEETSCVSSTGSDGLCSPVTGIWGVSALEVSPDGAHVYAISEKSIAVFKRNANDGSLSLADCIGGTVLCADAGELSAPRALVVSPDGRNVYVGQSNDDDIDLLWYSRDSNSGKLTLEGCLADETPKAPTDEGGTGDENADAESAAPTCGRARAIAVPEALTISGNGAVVASLDSPGNVSVLDRDGHGNLSAAACAGPNDNEYGCPVLDSLGTDYEFSGDLALTHDGKVLYAASTETNTVSVLAVTAGAASTHATVRGSRASLRVTCPRAARSGCRGAVRIFVPSRRQAGRAAVAAPITRATRYALAPGAATQLRLRVGQQWRRVIVRHAVSAVARFRDLTGRLQPVDVRLTLTR